MAKHTLTPEIRAQILAGANEIDLGDTVDSAVATATTAAALAAASPVTPTPAAATPVAPVAPAAPVPSADLVSYLTGQISAKESELLAANLKLVQAEAKAAEGQESLPGLLAIAQTVIGSMQIALGGSDTSKVLSAKDAVAEHAKLAPVYTEKFKVGGIAVLAAAVDDVKQPHPAFAQRLAAMSANRK